MDNGLKADPISPTFADHSGARQPSIIDEVREDITGGVTHVFNGLSDAYTHWRRNTNDSDQIMRYGAFELAGVATVGLLPKILTNWFGWEGGGVISGPLKVLTVGLTTVSVAV